MRLEMFSGPACGARLGRAPQAGPLNTGFGDLYHAASRCAAMLAVNSTPTLITRLDSSDSRSTQTTRAGIISRRFTSGSPPLAKPTWTVNVFPSLTGEEAGSVIRNPVTLTFSV